MGTAATTGALVMARGGPAAAQFRWALEHGGATMTDAVVRLSDQGAAGLVAAALLAAMRASILGRRAGNGGRHRKRAYIGKDERLDLLARALTAHAEELGLRWGWKEDRFAPVYRAVIYVDLPTGQVSFHADRRGDGPDYPGRWDRIRKASADRICGWCAQVSEARQ